MYKDEETGEVMGFNSVWCTAVAAAIFGPDNYTDHIQYFDHVPFANESHTVQHVNAITSTHTMEREVHETRRGIGRAFTEPYLYDGLRLAGDPFHFECAETHNFRHVDECASLMVCVSRDSTHHAFAMTVLPDRRILATDTPIAVLENFASRNCNVFMYEGVNEPLVRLLVKAEDISYGTAVYSKEPLAIVTPEGEPRFADFVNAVLHAVLAAEQHNITKATAELFPQTGVAFGAEYKNMFRNAIVAVGNYGEIYEHHLGAVLPRESINFINNGSSGLLYSHPFGRTSPEIVVTSVGPNLQRVLDRGRVICGIRTDRPGLALSANNSFFGQEVDLCRAVASGLFGGFRDSFDLVDLSSPEDGFQKLANGDVDVLAGATWSLENDVGEATTGLGFAFSQPYFFGFSKEEDNLCLATREDDHDWATLIYWIVAATIQAEQMGIGQEQSNEMPLTYLYGGGLDRIFRDAILAVGNYGDMYRRNLEDIIPRARRNRLNTKPYFGPQHYPMPGLL